MADSLTHLAGIPPATAHLIATAERLGDADMAKPSLLPGWTRGHVLTHLARGADALRDQAVAARTGERRRMYASPEARLAAIDAGAGRSAADIVDDVRTAADLLAEEFATMSAQAWPGTIQHRVLGDQPAAELPFMRLQELLVHHVDLDVDFTAAHWPESFTTAALDRLTSRFTGRDDAPRLWLHAEDTGARWAVGQAADAPRIRGPEAALLAWLTGRSNGDGLTVEPHGPLPPVPAWL